MKRIAAAFCALSMVAVISCNDSATNTTPKGDTTATTTTDTSAMAKVESNAPPMDSAAMMKAWMEYMTPGEMHKVLASQSGTWKHETTSWMAPGAPPVTSGGKSVSKMVLGGRYQETRYSGKFENMPFEGISTLAYDNAKKKFINTWIDNMGTGIMTMEGTYDPGTKTFRFEGKFTDPTSGKDCSARQTVTMTDDKHQTMEMWTTPSGQKEYKTMEIKYTKL